MADTAGVGCGIDARAEIGLGTATAGGDVDVFAFGEGGGFFDADDVVFEAEVGIDVVLGLEVAGDDAAAVGEGEDAAVAEIVRQTAEETEAEILEVFEVGLGDFAEEEALEAGAALAIVGAHLGEEPKTFTATAGATIADGGGAVGGIAGASGRAGGELTVLKDEARADEVFELIFGATGFDGGANVGIDHNNLRFRGFRFGRFCVRRSRARYRR